METLKEALTNWVDCDVAMHALAMCFGLVSEADPYPKGIYWSNNDTNLALYEILEQLVNLGAIVRDDEQRYRWVASYRIGK